MCELLLCQLLARACPKALITPVLVCAATVVVVSLLSTLATLKRLGEVRTEDAKFERECCKSPCVTSAGAESSLL